MWQRYKTALHEFCDVYISSQLRSRGKVQRVIDDAEENLVNKAHEILEKLQIGAQDVHPFFRKEIQRILGPIFQKAYAIKGMCMAVIAWTNADMF